MKKNLSLLMLLLILFSCKREATMNTNDKNPKTITLSQAIKKSSISAVASSSVVKRVFNFSEAPKDAFCGTAPFVLSGVTFIATNGKIDYVEGRLWMYIQNHYESANNVNNGSGFAMKYSFKKGKSYKITIPVGNKTQGELEAQLTNTIIQNNVCQLFIPNNVFGDDKPKFDFHLTYKASGQTDRSIEFTPDACYEYLWFSAQATDGLAGAVDLGGNITMVETPILAIEGQPLSCINTEGDFKVTASGYPISDQFDWKVTGGLQIIGSSTASSVRIKTNGKGGTISIGTGGCEAMAVKTIDASPAPDKIYGAIDRQDIFAGSAYDYFVSEVQGVTSYKWSTSYGTIISGQGTTDIKIQFPTFRGTIPMTYRVTLTTTNSCGETSVIIGDGNVKPCNNCPID